MAEEGREPGSAGPRAAQDGAAAASEPAVTETAAVVPGARKPEAAGDEQAELHGQDELRGQAEIDEQAEIERLRAEVRELRERGGGQSGEGAGQGGEAGGKPPRARGRWRAPVAAVVITIGCILAPISVTAVWAANQVSNTDRYVANMTPLISEPPIQQALSARITTEIESRLNVGALVSSTSAELTSDHLPRLSALLQNFSGPITSGVNSLVSTTVARAVASPAMAQVWVTANRAAHAGIVRVLSGQGNGSLSVVNNNVVLNLAPLIAQVKQDLVARGLTIAEKIPTVNATFPLFAAPNLAKAQQGYRLLTTLKWVLPLLSIALLVAGIFIAKSRRRGLIGASLGLAGSMLVLAIALAIARAIYLNSVPQSVLPSDAAAALYDTLVRFIKDGLRVLLLIGLVIAVAAFLAGPSAAAVATRRGVGSGIGWLRDRGERAGLHPGPVSAWTSAHKRLLQLAALGVVALVFVFWGQPSLALVIWLVVLLLVALGVIELLGGRPRDAAAVAEK